jgi:hypothetical protein
MFVVLSKLKWTHNNESEFSSQYRKLSFPKSDLIPFIECEYPLAWMILSRTKVLINIPQHGQWWHSLPTCSLRLFKGPRRREYRADFCSPISWIGRVDCIPFILCVKHLLRRWYWSWVRFLGLLMLLLVYVEPWATHFTGYCFGLCGASGNTLYWVLLFVYVGLQATHFTGYCCWFTWGLGQHTLLDIVVALCGASTGHFVVVGLCEVSDNTLCSSVMGLQQWVWNNI